MEQSSLFRKESVERIQSPEQLNDYLRITNPTIWVLLAAVIVLLAGMLIWSSVAYISSFAEGSAAVENGKMTVRFYDEEQAGRVESGMDIVVGDVSFPIKSVGRAEDGTVFALADTSLADGSYDARVTYRRTQLIRLLFN